MKLFRPLLILGCLAVAAIALTSTLFTTPVLAETVVAAPHDLTTAIVVADVMRIVSASLALLVVALAVVAIVLSTRRRSVAYQIDRRLPFYDPWWPYPS